MTPAGALGPQRVFISDCEGPISKNDNAFELTKHFVPKGDILFTQISRYDDILADVTKREGYKAGDTLKLILPFLRAYDVSNQKMIEFSSHNVMLMLGVKEMLEYVKGFMPSYIVSTSYEQYMRALCDAVSFPFKNVRCTRLDLDNYAISNQEKKKVKDLADEIVKLPTLEVPEKALSLSDFSRKAQDVVERLDEIFWKVIPSMGIARVLSEVSPVGGSEKAAAVKDIVSKLHVGLQDVMYIGDSITDVAAFQLVRAAGGLTVSLNGNDYAVREAEVAVLARDVIVTAVLAGIFSRFGKARLMTFVREWKPSTIKEMGLCEALNERFTKTCSSGFPRIELVTERNMAVLMRESTQVRKNVRGEATGRLG